MSKINKIITLILVVSLIGNIYFIATRNNYSSDDEYHLMLEREMSSSFNNAQILFDEWDNNTDLMNAYLLSQLSHSLDRSIEHSMFVNKYFTQLESFHNDIQGLQISCTDSISEADRDSYFDWYKSFLFFEDFASNNDVFSMTSDELNNAWKTYKTEKGLTEIRY